MTVNDFLTDLRRRIADVDSSGFTDPELIGYLNDALTHLYHELASRGDRQSIARIDIPVEGLTVPDDFSDFMGRYPCHIEDGVFVNDWGLEFEMTYEKAPSRLTGVSETVPVRNSLLPLAIRLTSLLALNAHEFDVSQDLMLLEKSMTPPPQIQRFQTAPGEMPNG